MWLNLAQKTWSEKRAIVSLLHLEAEYINNLDFDTVFCQSFLFSPLYPKSTCLLNDRSPELSTITSWVVQSLTTTRPVQNSSLLILVGQRILIMIRRHLSQNLKDFERLTCALTRSMSHTRIAAQINNWPGDYQLFSEICKKFQMLFNMPYA